MFAGGAASPTTKETPMLDSLKTPMTVAGRVLLALMFIFAGIDKLMHTEGNTAFMASGGLPAWQALTILAGLVELLGGLAVATGYLARWGALALALFTLSVSLIYHRYWSLPADQQMMQQLLFMKNMAVAGGMLVLAALGPGPASIGGRSGQG
jgi:putative oxidoreductase